MLYESLGSGGAPFDAVPTHVHCIFPAGDFGSWLHVMSSDNLSDVEVKHLYISKYLLVHGTCTSRFPDSRYAIIFTEEIIYVAFSHGDF
jgi:hypothetical protein